MVEAILEAAVRILAERGAAAATTRAIAERAGVSVGSFYQYFPTREAVLATLVRRWRLAMSQDFAEAVDRAMTLPLGPALSHILWFALLPYGRPRDLADLPPDVVEAQSTACRETLFSFAGDTRLVRALEEVERTLPRDPEVLAVRAGLGRAIWEFLVMHDIAEPHIAAVDLSAMTRGIAVAGRAIDPEVPLADLHRRSLRAAVGYLSAEPALAAALP